MKAVFLVIVVMHGLIHLLGFSKAFKIYDIKELTLPISKTFGIIWAGAALLFLVYAFALIMDSSYDWVVGLLAIIASQILVITFWTDARFGTAGNAIILLSVVASYGEFSFNNLLKNDMSEIMLASVPLQAGILTETASNQLPEPVRKWLFSTGAVGKTHIYAGWIDQKARIKMKPGQKKWYRAHAVQYTDLNTPAFIWSVDMALYKLLRIKGIDKFNKGKGSMLIKLNGLLPIVNEQGDKLDQGTIQRYLGEMVWFPTLAISPYIKWEQVDEHSARAVMSYKGTTGSGTFYFNEAGDFVKFTAMRYMENKPNAKQLKWVLTTDEYAVFEGIKVPSKMNASWELDDGCWTWLELEIVNIKYNEKIQQPLL